VKFLLTLATLCLPFAAHAKIYLDFEEDAVPVIQITVQIPQGFETLNNSEKGAGLLSDMLASGTKTLNRQAFNDAIAAFGADYSFDIGNDSSVWNLSFPLLSNLDYDKLIGLLNENWRNPRFTKESFDLAMTKYRAAFKGSLDNDTGLLRSTMLRWINKFEYGGNPTFFDQLPQIKLENVAKFFERDVRGAKDVWVGVVAPADSRALVEKIVTTIFKEQGEVKRGILKEALPSPMKVSKRSGTSKRFLLIDKKGRAQTVMGFIALPKLADAPAVELPFSFNDYLLFSNGLDAYFASVIRSEKGLAYGVYGIGNFYRRQKIMSIMSNPQRSRQEEAFQTFQDLIGKLFESDASFKTISDAHIERLFTSFKNARSLEFSRPDSRLALRSRVIDGTESYKFATSRGDDWKVERKELSALAHKFWINSAVVMGAVGDAKEVSPLIKKYFPDFKVVVIPFEKAILSTSFLKEP
jgi:predicted Zn-dependent peptidase